MSHTRRIWRIFRPQIVFIITAKNISKGDSASRFRPGWTCPVELLLPL